METLATTDQKSVVQKFLTMPNIGLSMGICHRKENLSAEQKADKAAKESDRVTKENRETSEKLRTVTGELTELKKQLQVSFINQNRVVLHELKS